MLEVVRSSEYNYLKIEKDAGAIFGHWNSKKIIVHKQLNNAILRVCDIALRKYDLCDILKAIDNYAIVVKESELQSNGYKQYIWSLREFLVRPNAMPEFFPDGSKWINHSRNKNAINIVHDNNYTYQTANEAYNAYLQIVRSMSYSEYLQTEHWKDFREKAIINASGKCQVCGDSFKLNVHHRIYTNLGNETFIDVVVLCKSCHSIYHAHNKIKE